MGFFGDTPITFAINPSHGLSHRMSWGGILLDWAGKNHEIFFADSEGVKQPLSHFWREYGLENPLNTATFDDIKKLIQLIDEKLLHSLPSQYDITPIDKIEKMKSLLIRLGYTAETLSSADWETMLDSHKGLDATDKKLLENKNLFDLTQLSMMFEQDSPIQHHLPALNYIRQTMHQGALLYATPKILETRVHDQFHMKRSLHAPERARSSFEQEVILSLSGLNQLEIQINSSFTGIVRDDFGEEVISASRSQAHVTAKTHFVVPLSAEKTSYDLKAAECTCHNKELAPFLRHPSLLEENQRLIARYQKRLLAADITESNRRRTEKTLALLREIESVLTGLKRGADTELITKINQTLGKPLGSKLALHLEHVKEIHNPDVSHQPCRKAIMAINQKRMKVGKRHLLLIRECEARIREYRQILETPSLPIHLDIPVHIQPIEDFELVQHKKTVLECAIRYINGDVSAEYFLLMRITHPRWSEATFISRAEKIVNAAIDLIEGRSPLMTTLDNAIEAQQIKLKAQTSIAHQQKLAVLLIAKEVLLDNDPDDSRLDKAIRANPLWKSGFLSTTKKVIEAVRDALDLAPEAKSEQHATHYPRH